ncbi:MAG: hypothetical protein ACREN8_12315 [Candidatus Dormibacteraceae bacterium]
MGDKIEVRENSDGVTSSEISEELARMVAKLDSLTRHTGSSQLAGRISLLQRHIVVEAQGICNLARRIERGDLP